MKKTKIVLIVCIFILILVCVFLFKVYLTKSPSSTDSNALPALEEGITQFTDEDLILRKFNLWNDKI